jgi:hypothetical protein
MTLILERAMSSVHLVLIYYLVSGGTFFSVATNVESTIINAKIVGGRPANRNEFPYIVSFDD